VQSLRGISGHKREGGPLDWSASVTDFQPTNEGRGWRWVVQHAIRWEMETKGEGLTTERYDRGGRRYELIGWRGVGLELKRTVARNRRAKAKTKTDPKGPTGCFAIKSPRWTSAGRGLTRMRSKGSWRPGRVQCGTDESGRAIPRPLTLGPVDLI
jgi:hypothetical protein